MRAVTVVRLGAFADIAEPPPGNPPGAVSIDVCEYALLADGTRVGYDDSRGYTSVANDGDTWRHLSRESVEDDVRNVLLPDDDEDLEPRPWEDIARRLRVHGVEASPAALEQLPFEIVLGDELGARLDAERTTAIIVTGAPGAGKTSVVGALSSLLEAEGVAHGALETEQLQWGHPWLPFEAAVEQLSAVIRMQRESGRRLFLLIATTETAAELRALRDAVGAHRVLVVALSAPPDTVAARVLDREPESWPGRDALAGHARELAAAIPRLDGVDVVLETGGGTPEAVARELRAELVRHGLTASR
jgi:chloramphenicol 3-O-phosphotransferase